MLKSYKHVKHESFLTFPSKKLVCGTLLKSILFYFILEKGNFFYPRVEE
jgi:hypothetical protein